jgi:hypothetical protein
MADAYDPTGLALVLLAAFWSGTSAVFGGIKETNDIRERILTGKSNDHTLTKADRWHALWWDWAPMKLSLAAISAVLCVVILALPSLHHTPDPTGAGQRSWSRKLQTLFNPD